MLKLYEIKVPSKNCVKKTCTPPAKNPFKIGAKFVKIQPSKTHSRVFIQILAETMLWNKIFLLKWQTLAFF